MEDVSNDVVMVDFYEECEDLKNGLPFGVLKCYCFKSNDQSEGSHIVEEVRMSELFNHVKGERDKIWVTLMGNPEQCEPVNFYTWYDNMRNTVEMNDILADVINSREKHSGIKNISEVLKSILKILKSSKCNRDH